jgi:hypothetical protein
MKKQVKSEKKKTTGIYKNISLSKILKDEGRSSVDFELMLSRLSLEELIGLKLEVSARPLNGKLFGMPIWYRLKNIVQDGILRYVVSAAATKKEAARMIGLHPHVFRALVRKYKIEESLKITGDNDDENNTRNRGSD